MSDDQPAQEAAAKPPVEQAVNACPVSAEILPPQYRKHVDPKAPVAIRGMAARGLVPLAPSDMITVLFMLMYDADAGVREAAGKTASTLPDRIAASAFRDEQVPPPVLGWFLTVYANNDAYAEMLILNGNTPDESVAAIAASCSKRVAEIIGQNQLRLLRHEEIIRELAKNPVAQGALIDGVCDFAVRNGLVMADVPQMQAARVRLFGPQAVAQPPAPEGPTAEEVIREFGMESDSAAEAAAPPMEEGKRLTLAQRIMKMNVAEKIKLATKGNKEARSILIRDANKLVSVAVIRSPRITDAEVLAQAQNKVAHDEVLRVIYSNREWLRKYAIKLALVKNPKVPQGVSMRLLNQLHESDVKALARDKNVSSNIQMLAKKQLENKKRS
jgi:hypothetical protein